MWQLTCENDLFEGKAIWLRPGSRHLLGRTSARSVAGEQVRKIDHKNVSRKHLVLEVSLNTPGDSSQVHVRSTVSATDNSKTGTYVNNSKIIQASITLDRTENKLQLGNSEYVFHINWVPVVITCANLPKSLKAKEDPVAKYRTSLEQTDIKLVATYISNVTTHVVASKRNNPSVLQGLAQAKWPVSYQWLEKLGHAVQAQSSGVQENDCRSALEHDLAEAWPAEADYLVGPGSEPVQRDKSLLSPDPRRSEVFSGLLFVFLTQVQYDSLMPVITACGGKAFVKVINLGTDTAADAIQYLRELAGNKSGRFGQTALSLPKTIVIRPSESKDREAEWSDLNTVLDSALGRPTIAQSELLDVILTLDTSSFQLPTGNADDTEPVHDTIDAISGEVQSSKQTRGNQAIPKSRFKGFQSFDKSQIARAPSPVDHESKAASLSDAHAAERLAYETDRPDKRKALSNGIQLPGMEAMKRRRLQEDLEQAPEQQPSDALAAIATKRAARPEQNADEMRSKLKAQMQQQEEVRARREEELKIKLDELDLEQYKDCAQIEEFDVKIRDRPRSGALVDREASRDWNPAWNGRANFKAFRPQGHGNGIRRSRVFVQLVEASAESNDTNWAKYMDDAEEHEQGLGSDSLRQRSGARTASHTTGHKVTQQLEPREEDDTFRMYNLKRPAVDHRGVPPKRQRQTAASHNKGRVQLGAYDEDEDEDEDDDDGLKFIRKRH